MERKASAVAARGTTALVRWLVFASFLTLFIQFPVVAPFARELGAGGALAGLIVGLFSVANIFGNLAAGPILDRWGRRWPLVVGICGAGLSMGACGFASSPVELAVFRFLHGFISGTVSPGTFAAVGDLTPSGSRGRAMGTAGALIAIAALVGPPLSGGLRDLLGPRAVFILGGALLLLSGVVFAVWGKETAVREPRERPALSPLPWAKLWVPFSVALSFTFGIGTLISHLPLRLEGAGYPGIAVGAGFAAYALTAAATMLLFGGIWRGRAAVDPLYLGLALLVLSSGILALPAGWATALLGMGAYGVGFGILFPVTAASVADSTSVWERGRAFGVFYALYSLGTAAGAGVAGLISQATSPLSGLPHLAAALVCAFSILWIKGARRAKGGG